MGGSAFAATAENGRAAIRTPRMTHAVYNHLREIYLRRLQEYFTTGKVIYLTEAPEKDSYGDVDFFVALDGRVDFQALSRHMCAVGCISAWQNCTLALPKESLIGDDLGWAAVHEDVQARFPDNALTGETYAQVDIEIVPSELADWHAFYTSYGDMSSLLGRIVTNLGFTVTTTGLWLRMRELDDSKGNPNLIIPNADGTTFLSQDPNSIMTFLGLCPDCYRKGFTTLTEFYTWLSKTPLLSADAINLKRHKADDHRREQTRTVYSRFFKEWLPANKTLITSSTEADQLSNIALLRAHWLDQALTFFPSARRQDFQTKHAALLRTLRNSQAADLLRPLLAKHVGKEGKKLNETLRAFRRWVGVDQEGRPFVLETPQTDVEAVLGLLLTEGEGGLRWAGDVDAWVQENWDAIRRRERGRRKMGVVDGGSGDLGSASGPSSSAVPATAFAAGPVAAPAAAGVSGVASFLALGS